MIWVWGYGGRSIQVRALLDTGAQGCIVSSKLVSRLRLNIRPTTDGAVGIGGVDVPDVRGQVNFEFTLGNTGTGVSYHASAVVLDDVVGKLPQVRLPSTVRGLTTGLELADPEFDTPGTVDVLLGSDVLGRFWCGRKRVLQQTGLVAVDTTGGYVIFGPVWRPQDLPEGDTVLYGSVLSEVLQRFWESEEPPTADRRKPEDDECELFYQYNTARSSSGRFVTRLPFLPNRPSLGSSRQIAERRLLAMERKMKRDAALRQKYIEFMREYLELGHMSVSSIDWRCVEHYYIPHLAVLKSPEAKIRVVFDGSAPTSNGVSVNQCLHAGPKLNRDIVDILTDFRLHQVAFVADVKMMFRQTIIHPDDRRYQLILWRESPDEPMVTYELNTVTYGLKPSPFLAVRTLRELAAQERVRFPRAAAVLDRDVYVDDICTGADSVQQALLLRDELIAIMESGGYELQKWLSSCPELLAGLPGEFQQDPHLFENPDNPNTLSILGVQYRPTHDVFTYQIEPDLLQKTWTKRSVLSTIARTFDPNGWIAPVTFMAKCFLQRLWLANLGWDDQLSGELLNDWTKFVTTLPGIVRIAMPRKLLPSAGCKATLHGFCDASERGYAAAVYLRTVSSTGTVDVRLVMAKSKVAPVRTRWTIPKLELAGAALLTRLLHHVASNLRGTINLDETVYAWTDSRIVLCWLQTLVHTLEVFVANRVSQIKGSETPLVWRHVPGEQNPADCASRGCRAPDLVGHSLWWGPQWLTESPERWPYNECGSPLGPPDRGLRVNVGQIVPKPSAAFLLERYSSLDKLLGVTGWIKQFVNNCRKPQAERNLAPVLSPAERNAALSLLVRVVQAEHFEEEARLLRDGRGKLKGGLVRLNPFVDEHGMLRVGGRLRNANLPFSARHPLLLPKKGPLVELIVRDRHQKNSHAGCNALLAILQREFWILSGRRTVRSIVFRCLPCYRLKAATMQPQMGDLPPDRVTEAWTFAGVGTDFAGPFMVKASRLRNAKSIKAYLCVFVCLATKAVHLELVADLTTEAFLAALDRFVSRRGRPALIRSDCGTNFKGADRCMKEIITFLSENEEAIGTSLSRQGINWVFDPPGCPHWGGIFEAVVKSAKTHLMRVIGLTILTFEELATVFCKIEAVLNSRPLCPLSSDPNDLEALTPGHFLIGRPLNALPEYPYTEVSSNRLTRYELLQQMSQNFWKRWSLEYLHILQQRLKWTDRTEPPRIGDLVLVKDANLPPLRWRRGRILNLFPGSDGTPRVATVQVGDSVLKRAIATLSRLPSSE
ncbi:hypothetical protein O0L34_g15054 [Tuta absoluta]|nr:hypothetical protein O0L34_g15054 [Tuta absoluta]